MIDCRSDAAPNALDQLEQGTKNQETGCCYNGEVYKRGHFLSPLKPFRFEIFEEVSFVLR